LSDLRNFSFFSGFKAEREGGGKKEKKGKRKRVRKKICGVENFENMTRIT